MAGAWKRTAVDPVAIHRRVGYLPGEFDLYDRLTGAQTIEYFGNLRGGIDKDYVARLIDMLDLDPSLRANALDALPDEPPLVKAGRDDRKLHPKGVET